MAWITALAYEFVLYYCNSSSEKKTCVTLTHTVWNAATLTLRSELGNRQRQLWFELNNVRNLVTPYLVSLQHSVVVAQPIRIHTGSWCCALLTPYAASNWARFVLCVQNVAFWTIHLNRTAEIDILIEFLMSSYWFCIMHVELPSQS